ELRSAEKSTARKDQRQQTPEALVVPSPEVAARLGKVLLGPIAAQLRNKRLVIVADGMLQYIPFAALPVPSDSATSKALPSSYSPLILNHEIISLPSASTVALLRQDVKDRKPAEKAIAVVADPVFEPDDERVAKAKTESTDKAPVA